MFRTVTQHPFFGTYRDAHPLWRQSSTNRVRQPTGRYPGERGSEAAAARARHVARKSSHAYKGARGLLTRRVECSAYADAGLANEPALQPVGAHIKLQLTTSLRERDLHGKRTLTCVLGAPAPGAPAQFRQLIDRATGRELHLRYEDEDGIVRYVHGATLVQQGTGKRERDDAPAEAGGAPCARRAAGPRAPPPERGGGRGRGAHSESTGDTGTRGEEGSEEDEDEEEGEEEADEEDEEDEGEEEEGSDGDEACSGGPAPEGAHQPPRAPNSPARKRSRTGGDGCDEGRHDKQLHNGSRLAIRSAIRTMPPAI